MGLGSIRCCPRFFRSIRATRWFTLRLLPTSSTSRHLYRDARDAFAHTLRRAESRREFGPYIHDSQPLIIHCPVTPRVILLHARPPHRKHMYMHNGSSGNGKTSSSNQITDCPFSQISCVLLWLDCEHAEMPCQSSQQRGRRSCLDFYTCRARGEPVFLGSK